MKCIVIGDPHFKTNNIQQCNLLISKVCKAIKQTSPDFVVCLGDLLDKHETYHETPFNMAVKFMKEISSLCKTFLIVGNHDYCNNKQFLSDRHPYNAMKLWGEQITIVDNVVYYCAEGLKFVFVPYVEPGRFIEALNSKNPRWEDADCIFAHQEFYGCKMGHVESVVGDKWDESYPVVVSGHIHNTQKVGSNIYYVGSSMQHAFGESDNKRIWLCEFSKDESFSYKKINLKLEKKKILYLSVDEFKALDHEKYKNENTKIKISLKCSYEEYKTFIKSGYKVDGVKVVHHEIKKTLDESQKWLDEIKSKTVEGKIEETGGVFEYKNVLKSLVENDDNECVKKLYEKLKN